MVNCAHPTHFQDVLADRVGTARRRGLRANASTRSHAELGEADDLDDGDRQQLGQQYRELRNPGPPAHRAGRVLRHRPAPRHGHRRRLRGGVSV